MCKREWPREREGMQSGEEERRRGRGKKELGGESGGERESREEGARERKRAAFPLPAPYGGQTLSHPKTDD